MRTMHLRATQEAKRQASKQSYSFASYQQLLTRKYKADVAAAEAEAKARGMKPAQVVADHQKLAQVPLGTWCPKQVPRNGVNPSLGKACKSNCRMLPCVFWNRRAEAGNADTYDADLL